MFIGKYQPLGIQYARICALFSKKELFSWKQDWGRQRPPVCLIISIHVWKSGLQKKQKKKNRVTKTLIVHNLYLMSSFETKWPVCNVLSLMTQLVFHARGDSNDTLNTHSNKKCVEILRGWLRNWLNMQLKGDSNLVRLLYFPVLSLFFITALFITSLPVPSESICGQSLGKENASIWFLRLYNL